MQREPADDLRTSSLLASYQLQSIERDLLCVLPSWPKSRVLELAPAFRKQTRQHEDAQQRLVANVFRALTLADPASPVCLARAGVDPCSATG